MIEGYLGIDVSKDKLDVKLLAGKPVERVFANSPKGHASLKNWTQNHVTGSLHACMESTGCYSYGPAMSMLDWCEIVSVENPRRIKAFGIAMGQLTKTDKADAAVIAEYCKRMSPRPWRLMDPAARELQLLVRRLSDLETLAGMESNRLENLHLPETVRTSVRRSHEQILAEREEVMGMIKANVSQDEKLKTQIKTLALLPGMGELTALRYMALIGGPENFDEAEDVPAFCGLYPLQHQSGKYKGRSTMCKAGDPLIRGVFHMPALNASRYGEEMKAFRERLESRGHKPISAIMACKRKLLMQCFGVLKALEEGREPTGLQKDKRIRWKIID